MTLIPHIKMLDEYFGNNAPEGSLLPIMLEAAVPLWMMKFQNYSNEEKQEELRRMEDSDFCCRMEYVLHMGPKEGDSAKAFYDLAKSIALLSFCPGGIRIFGRLWDWQDWKKPRPTLKRERPRL